MVESGKGRAGLLWPLVLRKPPTIWVGDEISYMKGHYHTVISPMRIASINRLLPHMAHALVARMTSTMSNIVSNEA